MDTLKQEKVPVTVVDDEEGFCEIIKRFLENEGYPVNVFSAPEKALDFIRRTQPDIVLTDMRMPKVTGFDILQASLQSNPYAKVVVITGAGDMDDCVHAMSQGAFNYIEKPWEASKLLEIVNLAAKCINEIKDKTHFIASDMGIYGVSEAIEKVRQKIRQIAPTNMTVLITGESGTGKELAARALHALSPRCDRSFVAINCAGIPGTLLESELFGFEKGSFTGAHESKKGLIEQSDGGTLFLDEIGEMDYELQAKLLRTLQEHEIQRIGSLKPVAVNLRVIAATNKNLAEEIKENRFRFDLFQRLNVIPLQMPPLRGRTEDIELLANLFLERFSRENNRQGLRLSNEALEFLKVYEFPGNVRKLQSMMMRAVALCTGNEVQISDIAEETSQATLKAIELTKIDPAKKEESISEIAALSTDYKKAKETWEHKFFLRIIKNANGNMTKAAEMAGISRRSLYEKLEKYRLKTSDDKTDNK